MKKYGHTPDIARHLHKLLNAKTFVAYSWGTGLARQIEGNSHTWVSAGMVQGLLCNINSTNMQIWNHDYVGNVHT